MAFKKKSWKVNIITVLWLCCQWNLHLRKQTKRSCNCKGAWKHLLTLPFMSCRTEIWGNRLAMISFGNILSLGVILSEMFFGSFFLRFFLEVLPICLCRKYYASLCLPCESIRQLCHQKQFPWCRSTSKYLEECSKITFPTPNNTSNIFKYMIRTFVSEIHNC